MSILYPDVPLTDGVPPVLRSVIAPVVAGVAMMTRDGDGIAGSANEKWGIFTPEGAPVLLADAISAIDINGEAQAADYPLEGGGFESYNKVSTPFAVRVEMVKSGDKDSRIKYLETLESMRNSTDLFSVVMPDRTFSNVTLTRYEIMRSSELGPQALRVAVSLEEIRVQARIRYLNDRSPNGLATESGGSVQTRPPATTPEVPN